MSKIIIFFIKGYQKTISKILPNNTCRFHPTCSQYAVEAYEEFGFVKGTRLTLVRLSKCHPLHKGGFDPIIKNK